MYGNTIWVCNSRHVALCPSPGKRSSTRRDAVLRTTANSLFCVTTIHGNGNPNKCGEGEGNADDDCATYSGRNEAQRSNIPRADSANITRFFLFCSAFSSVTGPSTAGSTCRTTVNESGGSGGGRVENAEEEEKRERERRETRDER